MSFWTHKTQTSAGLVVVVLLFADSAHALRCKNKLVNEGMHEQQVIAACGQPTTRRVIGQAVRVYDYGWQAVNSPYQSRRWLPGYGGLSEEVIVTEYTYNFGPRKLMRRLVFEGGILVTIETIGYGYIEKDAD
jgi:hypothetical protein